MEVRWAPVFTSYLHGFSGEFGQPLCEIGCWTRGDIGFNLAGLMLFVSFWASHC